MGEEIYDVLVLGGGAGGVPAAIRAWATIEKVTKKKDGLIVELSAKEGPKQVVVGGFMI